MVGSSRKSALALNASFLKIMLFMLIVIAWKG